MKKGVLITIGTMMIIVGIAGIMLTFEGKTIGYAVSNILPNLPGLFNNPQIYQGLLNESNVSSSIEISEISEVIIRPGDKKILNLNAKNLKETTLTNCKLIQKNLEKWFSSSDDIKELPPGEKIPFTIEINVPEESLGEYEAELEIKCNEDSVVKKFAIKVLIGSETIKVEQIEEENRILNISYIFDHTSFIGETAFIEIWVENFNEAEIMRVIDVFSIKKEGLIKRNILIGLREQPSGIYYLYIAPSSDLNNYIKKTFVLGEYSTTGKAIFKIAKGKIIPYLIFLVIIGTGVFFIFKSYRKSVQEEHEKEHI